MAILRSELFNSLTYCLGRYPKDLLQLRLETDYSGTAAAQQEYIHGLEAYSGCSSASTGASLADQSRRASLSSQSSGDLPGFLGNSGSVRYITSVPALQDVSFHTGAGYSMTPINAGHDTVSTSPSSAPPSSLAFSPFSNVFQTNLTGPVSYQPSASSPYSAATTCPQTYTMSDFRPRNHSTASGMLPPSRSSTTQNPVSPLLVASARENYQTSTPFLMRHSLPNRSSIDSLSRPSFSNTPRSGDSTATTLSPASSGSYGVPTNPLQLDPSAQLSLTNGGPGPPLEQTSYIHTITSAEGHTIQPDINARIDKGFFLADHDWTCYRRNYFSVACSFTLTPLVGTGQLYLHRSNAPPMTEAIHGFFMTISAIVDGPGGKPVELVQHTPKRDKGPQGKPERVKLNPHTAGSLGVFPGSAAASGALASTSHGHDQCYLQPGEQQTVATFERIQFKSATANNGKRRAAQQYYHLVVELFVDVGQHVKIASRMSVPMVVRGRSPGHYQDDRRGSSSSAGPGGAGGNEGGGGPGGPGGPPGGSRSIGDTMSLMGGPGAMLGGGGYHSGSGSTSMRHSPSSMHGQSISSGSSSTGHLDHHADGLLSGEGDTAMGDATGYNYYPAPFLDAKLGGHRHAPTLPPFTMPSFNGTGQTFMEGRFDGADGRRPLKEEMLGGPNLPPPIVPWQSSNFSGRGSSHSKMLHSSCGRLDGTETTRGYYSDLPASS